MPKQQHKEKAAHLNYTAQLGQLICQARACRDRKRTDKKEIEMIKIGDWKEDIRKRKFSPRAPREFQSASRCRLRIRLSLQT